MRAIQVRKHGGPEVLELTEVPAPQPSERQVLVRIEAIGVNFIDVYHRTGLYRIDPPFIPGSEAAGKVEALGPGAEQFRRGDPVAWAGVMGSYAEYAVVPEDRLVPLPAGVDARTAAAAMLQGMTAHYLATSTYVLKAGDSALIHAAAGGVGALLIQVAKIRSARVFGTVSTEEKAAIAGEAGADEIILYTRSDFEAEVMQRTGKRGVNVVYDGVGKTTFDKSLNCVARRGTLVMYGQSSGPVPPFDLSRLSRNAIFVTRPSLGHYTAMREELLMRATELFSWILSAKVRLRIDRQLPLGQAAEAHRLLEGRQTAGKLLLIP
jgi:NADPH2:quinone reductase